MLVLISHKNMKDLIILKIIAVLGVLLMLLCLLSPLFVDDGGLCVTEEIRETERFIEVEVKEVEVVTDEKDYKLILVPQTRSYNDRHGHVSLNTEYLIY